MDKPSVENSTKKCFEAVLKKDLRAYDDILKSNVPDFSDRFGSDGDQIYDRFTDADWYFINQVCHYVPNEEMMRINPAPKSSWNIPMVFSGYAKPGKQIVIIYDH